MIHTIFLIPLSLLLVILQTSILDLFFFNRINVEISLILVIYAGFRLGAIRGAALSFAAGFFMDCMMGSASGLYTLLYVCIFFISSLVSLRVYAEGTALIMLFTFLCAISQGLFIVLFYKAIYNVNMFHNMILVFLPQALVLSFLSPVFFKLFRVIEGYMDEGNPQPAQWS
jgi:rod shape-determining protein MreD